MAANPIFPGTLKNAVARLSSTTLTTLLTGGTSGSKVESIAVTNTYTAAYTAKLYVTYGGTDYLLGTVSVPLSAGNTTSAVTFDLLSSSQLPFVRSDEAGRKYLYLESGYTLKAQLSSYTSGNVDFFLQYGDF